MAKPKKKRAREAVTSLKALLSDVDLSEKKAPSKGTGARHPGAKRSGATSASGSSGAKKSASKSAAAEVQDPPARPSESLRGDDRIAWFGAIAGVRPLTAEQKRAGALPPGRAPVRPADTSADDDEARRRLHALVAGAIRFELERDGDWIRGWRVGTRPDVARALGRAGAVPEATLDLHGDRGDEAARRLVRFVRAEQRAGSSRVCVIHGKGLHSAHGVGVLRERVLETLTDGGAAPVVRAFSTAAPTLGGTGALMIELTRR